MVLIAIAVVLVVVHLVLDAGAGREAPRGLLWVAVAAGLGGALLGGTSRRR